VDKFELDLSNDPFAVGHNVVVREPDHAITLCLEITRSGSILGFAANMGLAIDFDHQSCSARDEITDERPNRELPVEARVCYLPARQRDPEPFLGLGSVAA
jgi:hypothetical protein